MLFLIYLLYFFCDFFYQESGRYLWTLLAIIFITIPFGFERISGMYFPWEIKIVITLSLLLHTAGEFHRWYYTLMHYDKISHFASAAGIAYLVFLFIILIRLYYGLEWNARKMAFVIILMTCAFALFWEWWEIFSDSYFGSKFFWNMQDGVGDAAANIAGGIIVAWDTKNFLEVKSHEEIAQEFILRDENGHNALNWSTISQINDRSQKEGDEYHI